MYHEWSERDFDWAALGKAMHDIQKWARHTTGMKVVMKEKYGTVRYETYLGLSQFSIPRFFQLKLFEIIIYFVCRRYGHVAREILEELLADYTPKIPWFARPWVKENPLWQTG